MADTPSRGVASLMAIATAGSTNIASLVRTGTLFTDANCGLALEFVSESVGLSQQIIDASGIRGSQSHINTRTRFGVRNVGGQITLEPSAIDLVNLAPILIGPSSALSENGPTSFDLAIGRDAKDFFYDHGKVTSVTFGSSTGGILTVQANCVFTDETISAGGGLADRIDTATSPKMLNATAQAPLMHFDTSGAVLMDPAGTTPFTATPEAISWTIDHGVMTDRFRNSNLITSAPSMDRVVSLTLMMPYNAEVAAATTLYPIPYGGYTGGGGSTVPGKITITYTNGDVSSKSAAFAFQCVKFNRQTPVVSGRGEVMIPFVGRAFWDGSVRELVATLDGS